MGDEGMKLISWNVNGLRACLKKGFMESFGALGADVFALQETKMQPGQAILELSGYQQYWNSAEKKGYSGTAVFTRIPPLSGSYGLGIEEHDHEGRVITLEFPEYYFVTVYTPNSKRALERLEYRMVWEDAFREYLLELDKKKPVIVCGDLNVAHEEIDIKNPKTNHMPVSRTRNGQNSHSSCKPDFRIPFGTSIRTGPAYTHGGPISARQGKRMRDGASIISWCLTVLWRRWRMPRSTMRFSAATIALSGFC